MQFPPSARGQKALGKPCNFSHGLRWPLVGWPTVSGLGLLARAMVRVVGAPRQSEALEFFLARACSGAVPIERLATSSTRGARSPPAAGACTDAVTISRSGTPTSLSGRCACLCCVCSSLGGDTNFSNLFESLTKKNARAQRARSARRFLALGQNAVSPQARGVRKP